MVMNTYDAEYERGAEGVVNLITKGGSDHFHGEVYDFLLNSSLNANTWSNDFAGAPKGKLHRNQFGANVGGFIWKSHHLYFFGAYEGLRQPQTDIERANNRSDRAWSAQETSLRPTMRMVLWRSFTIPIRRISLPIRWETPTIPAIPSRAIRFRPIFSIK